MGAVGLGDGKKSIGRVAAGVPRPRGGPPVAPAPRAIPARAPGQRLARVGRELRPVDVAPYPISRGREAGLGSPLPRADAGPREEEIAIPARDASDVPATVALLTLLEGGTTHTRDAPDGAVGDVGPLEPSLHGALLAETSRIILVSAPAP